MPRNYKYIQKGGTDLTEVKKSYYAIIPANVRYDSDLIPNAKLLYGEITALCNEKGYCWASNGYFAELYGVSKISISKWINQLIERRYLSSDIIYKEGTKEILYRYIRIVNDPIKENFNTPIKEKFKENNTVFNNTSNNKDIDDFEKLWSIYPQKKGKAKARQKILNLLKKYSLEELTRVVERYAAEVKDRDKQYIQHGSTFFNSTFEDYIDKNYVEGGSKGGTNRGPTTKDTNSKDYSYLINN